MRGVRKAAVVTALLLAGSGGVVGVAGAGSASAAPTAPSGGCTRSGDDVTCDFVVTNAPEPWTVPDGVTSVRFAVFGAQGGRAGGLGALVEATVAVTAGQAFTVVTGSSRGYGGGRDGGVGVTLGGLGNGGGASSVTDADGDLLVAGGGGGGAARTTGGSAGHPGADFGSGSGREDGRPGGGGDQERGGRGGDPSSYDGLEAPPGYRCFDGVQNPAFPIAGGDGSAGRGGNGAFGSGGGSGGGGGGGGGFFGGGGGGAGANCVESDTGTTLVTSGGAGGGGSSWFRPSPIVSDVSFGDRGVGSSQFFGVKTGDGLVRVSFVSPDADGASSVSVARGVGQADPALVGPVVFDVVFSQPVTGFGDTASDMVLSGTAGPTTATVTGSGAAYQVAVSGMTSAGTVVLSVPAGAAVDGQFSPNAASTGAAEVAYAPDTTGPVVTADVSGTPGDDGWFVSDVQVSWSVSDPESPVTGTSGCDPVTVSADTPLEGLALTCTATSGGGSTSESVTVKRDATAPVLAPTGTPDPVILGGTVSVVPNASDEASGLASASCGSVSTAAIGPVSAECVARDVAGNTATASARVTVAAFFGSWVRPAPGAVSVKAGSSLRVEFSLRTASGQVSGAAGAQLVQRRQVKVVLSGPRGPVAATTDCSWRSAAAVFRCTLELPDRLAKGAAVPYLVTVQERARRSGSSWFTVPGGTVAQPNPRTLQLR